VVTSEYLPDSHAGSAQQTIGAALTLSAGNTYTQAGCPQTCTSFVQNNPIAFADAFWSINSLRVYTATGKAAAGDGLGAGAIAGIVVGVVGGLVLFALLFWRYRKTKARR